MRILNLGLLLLIAIIITSCEVEKIDESILNRSIRVNAYINNTQTKATGNEWTSGDMIGIYMIGSKQSLSDESIIENNVKYTTTGDSKFKPATDANDIKFPIEGENVDFIAYYPHSSIASGYLYNIDISKQEDQEAIDLMYSDNAVNLNRYSNYVDMKFTHQLSKIVVNIETNDGSVLQNVTASIKGINTKGKFSLVNQSISSSAKGNIKMKVSSNGKFAEAILIPTDNLDGATLEITNGKYVYVYDLGSSSKIKEFESGYRYSYTITLDPNSTNVSVIVNANSSINNWFDGPSENATLGKNYEIEETIGDGTKENPYSIDEARDIAVEKGVWVKGYIVGYYTGNTTKTLERDLSVSANIKNTSFAIASSPYETDGNNTFPVALKIGKIRDALNLRDNPYNLDVEVIIKGNIDRYYGSIGFKDSSDFELLN